MNILYAQQADIVHDQMLIKNCQVLDEVKGSYENDAIKTDELRKQVLMSTISLRVHCRQLL